MNFITVSRHEIAVSNYGVGILRGYSLSSFSFILIH